MQAPETSVLMNEISRDLSIRQVLVGSPILKQPWDECPKGVDNNKPREFQPPTEFV